MVTCYIGYPNGKKPNPVHEVNIASYGAQMPISPIGNYTVDGILIDESRTDANKLVVLVFLKPNKVTNRVLVAHMVCQLK